MPKEEIQAIEDEYTVNGQPVVVRVGEVMLATPRDGSGPEYLRLQYTTGESYLWGAPVADWNQTVAEDDPRWVRE